MNEYTSLEVMSGRLCADFLKMHRLSADLIASHGHTIFHNPEEGYTFQLGNDQRQAFDIR